LTARMIEGEILVRENKLDAGIAELREAIKLEDALNYDEPPGVVNTYPTLVRRDLDAKWLLCRSGRGLSRRLDAITGKRLVALRPGEQFKSATEERE